MQHKGIIIEYKLNAPAYRFKYICSGCNWQSYQETLESADGIGQQHESQFTSTQSTSAATK